MGINVKKALDHIKQALEEAEKMKADKFTLYYVGHGHDSGGWVTYPVDGTEDAKTKYVQIADILDAIKESDYENSVEIISESCYSGQACHNAKDWWEK